MVQTKVQTPSVPHICTYYCLHNSTPSHYDDQLVKSSRKSHTAESYADLVKTYDELAMLDYKVCTRLHALNYCSSLRCITHGAYNVRRRQRGLVLSAQRSDYVYAYTGHVATSVGTYDRRAVHRSFSEQLGRMRKAQGRSAYMAWVPEISPLTNSVHVHAIIRTSHALNTQSPTSDMRLLATAGDVAAWCTYILKDLSDVATRMGALSLGGLDTMHSFYGPGGLNEILKTTTT